MGVTRRTVLKTLAATGVGAIAGPATYGYLYERHEITVTRANVPVSDLPQGLNGLRVGLITDIHRSSTVSHDDVSRAVNALMAEHTDLIVLGGDYVTYGDRQFVGPSADALAPLSAHAHVVPDVFSSTKAPVGKAAESMAALFPWQ